MTNLYANITQWDYEEAETEVSELKKPVDFKDSNAKCSLIVHFRDGKPVYEGDPQLSEVPF